MNEQFINQPRQEKDKYVLEIKSAVENFLGQDLDEQSFNEGELEDIDLKIWSKYNHFKEQAENGLIDRVEWDKFLVDFQSYKESNANKSRKIFIDTVFQGIVDLMEKTEPNTKVDISPEVKKSLENMSENARNQEAAIRFTTEALQRNREKNIEPTIVELQTNYPNINFDSEIALKKERESKEELLRSEEELRKAGFDSEKTN